MHNGISRAPDSFTGRVLILGFGSIGQGVLPLLLRQLQLPPERLLVVTRGGSGTAVADACGVAVQRATLTPQNMAAVLGALLKPGDFLLNLSVDVGSVALMAWCQDAGVLYLDTCTEAWPGHYTDARRPPAERSNHALRRSALALRRRLPRGPTAVMTHGANPGLVSHFVKQALLDLDRDVRGHGEAPPRERAGWARLAQRLGVRAIHIAERDSQVRAQRKQAGEFVNTWSAQAFAAEATQPAELGWGTHERRLPADGAEHPGEAAPGIYLNRPGATVRVRSWTPGGGPMHGLLITHAESLSIAEHLTLGDPARPEYRPTVHYAYRPCDDAVLSLHELAERDWKLQVRRQVMKDDLLDGIDELGVLLLGHARGAYWYGSQLTVAQARQLCPHNNPTSLQVAAPVAAAMSWAMRHPAQGIVEPDDLPYDEMLTACEPWLGRLVGVYSDWTPLSGRSGLFDDTPDWEDPWQFCNVRVA